MRIVDAANPEQNSDFFKLLGRMRDACTNAAQVREILCIRTDKVARERVLETDCEGFKSPPTNTDTNRTKGDYVLKRIRPVAAR